jgi:hypothetical protein
MKHPPYIDGKKHMGSGQYIGPSNHSYAHQFAIRNFLVNWDVRQQFEVVPTFIVEGIPGKISKKLPDLVICRINTEYPVIVVEISESDEGYTYDMNKIREMLSFHPNMLEGFVLRLEKKEWWRLRKDELTPSQTSHSIILNLDLESLVP